MRNAGLEETQAGIKIVGRIINNLRYADDTILMAEVKIGEDNEILLRGKTITKGYYKKAEATAAAIEVSFF